MCGGGGRGARVGVGMGGEERKSRKRLHLGHFSRAQKLICLQTTSFYVSRGGLPRPPSWYGCKLLPFKSPAAEFHGPQAGMVANYVPLRLPRRSSTAPQADMVANYFLLSLPRLSSTAPRLVWLQTASFYVSRGGVPLAQI